MKISIIIPVLNTKEDYLRASIDSALSQTLKDIEILIIDNGSDEYTLNILKEYEAKNNNVKLSIEPNGRQGKARNVGLKNAKEYIAFLDSDDWLSPNTCEVLYTEAAKENLDILKTDYCVHDESAKSCINKKLFDDNSFYNKIFDIRYDKKILNAIPYIWNGLYKRNFLLNNKIMFNESCINEDCLFYWQTTILAKKMMLINFSGIYYRKTMVLFQENFIQIAKI
ncbi:MAG: glycosyltransferase [Desulfosudis oleivorans]|nr:glycosyltransferase [Desulfosudis oleivorans]